MTKPEYLAFRCCMCPNIQSPAKVICPSGPSEKQETSCRFVKMYQDERGWKYKVMPGLGENNFKGRYQKPGKSGWKCMAVLPWKDSFDEAQTDLNAYAKKKGWDVLHG